jgi:hypothetical protein
VVELEHVKRALPRSRPILSPCLDGRLLALPISICRDGHVIYF